MTEWTAAEIGSYDQALASANTELDRLVLMLRTGTAKVGERQAMANVGLRVSQEDPRGLTGLLMAALKRLAASEEQ